MKNHINQLLAVLLLVASLIGTVASPVEAADPIKIGILQPMDHPSLNDTYQGIVDGLADKGYTDGKEIKISYMNAGGTNSNMQSMAEKLARENDYVFAIATPAVQALANVTTEVPIYFAAVADPLGAGVVDSIESTGRNVTGVSNLGPIEDQINLMLNTIDDVKKVGLIYNSGEVNAQYQIDIATGILKDKGLETEIQTITSTNDINSALSSLLPKVDVLLLVTDNTVASAMKLVGDMAKEQGLATFGGSNEMAEENGLATYGLDYYGHGKQTADMVVRAIEEGEKPQDQPVEYTKEYKLVVNEDYAKALGMDPASIQAPN
ncbi:ABC transporter substrate binding protein [Hutsoniella sourekii]